MTLKNVVLPAPFGPMRLTIEPSGITKSTPATATSPPNCLVTARASRTLLIAPAQSPGFAGETRLRQRGFARRGSTAPRSSLHVHELRAFLLDGALVFLRGVQLGAHARAWEQALRADEHHHDQRDAEDELAGAAHIHDCQILIPDRAAEAVDETVDPVEEHAIDEAEHQPAGDNPTDVAKATEDDHA